MNILTIERCKSTNESAKNYIDQCINLNQEQYYTVFVANKQTQGKTRKPGKTWWSPEDAGIYMSVIARLPESSTDLITTLIGYRLMTLLRNYTLLDIKQRGVNDLYLADRKLAGILCEVYQNRLIVGIGLNLFQPSKVRKDLLESAIWLNEFASELLLNRNFLVKMIAEAI